MREVVDNKHHFLGRASIQRHSTYFDQDIDAGQPPVQIYCSSAALHERMNSSCQTSTSERQGGGAASYVLGIESSCDDTAVAVMRASDGAVLGHSIANQVQSHPILLCMAVDTRLPPPQWGATAQE